MKHYFSYPSGNYSCRIYVPSVRLLWSRLLRLSFLIMILMGLHFTAHAHTEAFNSPYSHVTGIVVDSAGQQPLPGATITIKGTTEGTTTDIDGRFSLKAPNKCVLIVSYVGYKTQEISIDGDTTLHISLPEAHSTLNEVVVTALGIKKEKRILGYATQEISSKSINKVPTPTVMGALTGKVAGLQINNTTDFFRNPTITLRGRTPLMVIDGIPDRDGDLWKINANDIKKITVLKGSTASALYGSIGRNGAIMITTKSGKENTGLKVSYNSSSMFQTGFIRIPHVQTTYGGGNNGQYAYVNGSGSGTEGGGWIWGPKFNQKDPNTPSGYWETPQYNSPIDSTTGKRIPIPWISRGKNNVRNFFRTGLITDNNLSITAGNHKGSFRASIDESYQRGIVPNTKLNNTSFSLSGNYNFTKSLSFNTSLFYNRQNTPNYPSVGYGPTNYLYNLVLWTGADVNVLDLRNYWVKGKEGIQQYNYNNSWYNNPYFIAYQNLHSYTKDNTYGSFSLNYQILPSLSVKIRSGFNVYGRIQTIKEPRSYIAYGYISPGNYFVNKDNYFDITSDAILQYKHSFGKNFSINAEVGVENFISDYSDLNVNTDGLTIPEFYNLSNSINPMHGTNAIQQEKTNSVYGSTDLAFFNSFYLTLTGRNDWVSTLPIQNNSFFYPSVAGSFILSDIFKLPQWVSFLKLRGSWSRVSDGTIGSNPYGHIQTYTIGNKWNNVPSLVWGGTLLSSNLHPETSDQWETGITTNFFKNRLGIYFTYWQAKDYNNLTQIEVSKSSGYDYYLVNGNVYQRKGLELVLTGMPVTTSNFKWNVTVNLNNNHRYLKNIYGGQNNLGFLKVGDRTDRIYTSVYETDGHGNIVYGANGFPIRNPFKRYIGNSDPNLIYGIQNMLSYKNITLSFSIDGRIGGLMYSTTNYKMWWGGTSPGEVNQFRDDANAGKATYVGKGVVVTSGSVQYDANGNITSDTREFAPNTTPVSYISFMETTANTMNENYFYYSQTFLRLRQISLTYKLPALLLGKSIQAASVSFIGENLLLFSKIPNVDPDPGVDNLQSPSTRNIGIRLNIQF